jgi:hypothetical protein
LLTHPAPIKQFIRDGLQSDRGNLTVSLAQFAGNPAYGPDALLGDFARRLPPGSRLDIRLLSQSAAG